MTVADLVKNAALELGVVAQDEDLSTADQTYLIGLLNRILNAWNADRRAVYATAFETFTLVPNLSPHTIGPDSATFDVDQRPVSLDGANLVLTGSTPNVTTAINIRDNQWWLGQSVQEMTSDIPTDVYYQPDWPNGKLFFWPVPDAAYDVQLMTRVLLIDVLADDDDFTLPPGYEDAVTLTLAERARRGFAKQFDPELVAEASKARALIFGVNDVTPHLETKDAGMTPGRGSRRADFNYLNGQIV